ncbi:hypothetical protein COU61_04955 [Candidatus Pacearchaeota archaeon CG10_big_fil_rev_8_21_14_0_10_35_13]|nr:MAG: hypothetical protein COU61_04955 [Candidatus Pacearchaeota archaeon CG10_big_fil_rev_8_21_14_0_10_35_13]
MSFVVYDLSFLVIFTLAVIIFIYKKKHQGRKMTREGLMYLYKTQVGVRFIDKIGTKYEKIIKALKYPVITLGYILLAGILFILGQAIYIYIKVPEITKIIKTPPLVPLIPYFPEIFGAQSLFPPFYFVYFIIALIIVAFVHEFSHGIFARANKVRIKSTGVVFLGPILGAFVEQDDKQMLKRSNSEQMSILGAGVFANIITAIIFFLLLLIVFHTMFTPSGAVFSTYSYGVLSASSITNMSINSEEMITLQTINGSYILDKESYDKQISEGDGERIIAFYDAPAINNKISGAITRIDGRDIKDLQEFVEVIGSYKPGEKIELTTTEGTYEIILGKNPTDEKKQFLGVGFQSNGETKGMRGLYKKIFFFKDPSTYYQPKLDGVSVFIYDLLWWIAMINFMVGLFNMLPFAFLDGGRFFYLTVLSITKSEKFSQRSFKWATRIILLMFVALMFVWVIKL